MRRGCIVWAPRRFRRRRHDEPLPLPPREPVVIERPPAALGPVETLEKLPPSEIPAAEPTPAPTMPGTDPLLTAEELRALLQESHPPRTN